MQKTVYSILFMSSFEKKESFLGEFYLRLNEKKIKNWLQGSLGCGLFLEKWIGRGCRSEHTGLTLLCFWLLEGCELCLLRRWAPSWAQTSIC